MKAKEMRELIGILREEVEHLKAALKQQRQITHKQKGTLKLQARMLDDLAADKLALQYKMTHPEFSKS